MAVHLMQTGQPSVGDRNLLEAACGVELFSQIGPMGTDNGWTTKEIKEPRVTIHISSLTMSHYSTLLQRITHALQYQHNFLSQVLIT